MLIAVEREWNYSKYVDPQISTVLKSILFSMFLFLLFRYEWFEPHFSDDEEFNMARTTKKMMYVF
jgi:hypothetical protein